MLGKILISPLFLRRAPVSDKSKREKGKKKVRQGKLSREKSLQQYSLLGDTKTQIRVRTKLDTTEGKGVKNNWRIKRSRYFFNFHFFILPSESPDISRKKWVEIVVW